ncbi:hypothetical protein MMC30_005312 [Trapelia coarctata]|nr:hypothetical protein [Trapelia coarctata]
MAQQEASSQPQGFKNHIQNVAIVGAGGNCGKFMAEALLGTGKHVVSAITRAESTTQLPDGVQVKRVNYDDQSSIVEALRGQDALIITMGVTAPKDQEAKLIEAAAEAGVSWVFPNEWSPDMANESLAKDTLLGDGKKKHRDLVAKLGKSSWIAVSTGFWYEWSLALSAAYGFDFANRAVTLFDDGETPISTSTFAQVGRAMAALLSLKIHADGEDDDSPCIDRFKNGYVYVASFTVSQKDMLESVLRVTQTSLDDWKVTKESVQGRYAAGMEQMKRGDRMGFVKVMYSRVFYPDDSGNVEKTRGLQNDALGLSKEDLDECTKIAIRRAEVHGDRGY